MPHTSRTPRSQTSCALQTRSTQTSRHGWLESRDSSLRQGIRRLTGLVLFGEGGVYHFSDSVVEVH